jgi:hypothetical protein
LKKKNKEIVKISAKQFKIIKIISSSPIRKIPSENSHNQETIFLEYIRKLKVSNFRVERKSPGKEKNIQKFDTGNLKKASKNDTKKVKFVTRRIRKKVDIKKTFYVYEIP